MWFSNKDPENSKKPKKIQKIPKIAKKIPISSSKLALKYTQFYIFCGQKRPPILSGYTRLTYIRESPPGSRLPLPLLMSSFSISTNSSVNVLGGFLASFFGFLDLAEWISRCSHLWLWKWGPLYLQMSYIVFHSKQMVLKV